METAPETLPNDIDILKKLLLSERQRSARKDEKLAQLEKRYHYMLEQFRLAQQKQFGKSSEAHSSQHELFNEAEQLTDIENDQKVLPVNDKKTPSLRKPKRQPLPTDLPRESIIHDINDNEKTCDCCGHGLHKMGEEKSEQLEFIPASIKVIEHIRPKYSCRHCEQQNTTVMIKIAPVPLSPIPKSIATASLLSQIITSKYQYSLPLYRQESLFKQWNINLSRQTMAQWMLNSANVFTPLYVRLHEILLQQQTLQADETPLTVLKVDKVNCYMWLYCSGGDSPDTTESKNKPPNIVLYDYQDSRAAQCAKDFLQNYTGYLQVDGYRAYEHTNATLVGCWAHARRKFIEAKQAQVKGKSGRADWAISHIQKLYRIESELKDKTPEEIVLLRQAQAGPLLEQFKVWLDKSALHVPPKSAVGKAVAYCLNQWPKLCRYIENGHLAIDNNRAERAIKPFVIGRKNWMFANTQSGARASAVLYSMVETAKANGLIPFDYIQYCLEQLATKPNDLDYLLPWNVNFSKV